MSIPVNAKAINSISTSNFYYLYDINDIKLSYSKDDWLKLGGPKKNINSVDVSHNIIYTLSERLKDKGKIIENPGATSIFVDHPQLLNVSISKGDLSIGNTATDIYITFIEDNAGYTNAVGYYFYVIENNTKKILANIDDSDAPTYVNGYYNPTIIFPNASEIGRDKNFEEDDKIKHGQLKLGDQRRLRGNNPNGSFQNINVGFFLIPDGWDSSKNGVVYNNLSILHTTPEFNNNYVQNSLLLNQNGIQSALFNIDGSIILTFEDLLRPNNTYHASMRDNIFMITATPSLSVNAISLTKNIVESKLIKLNRRDKTLTIKKSQITNISDTNKKYKLKHFINTDSDSEIDLIKDSMEHLNYKYPTTITKTNTKQALVEVELTKDDIDDNTFTDSEDSQDFKVKVKILDKVDNLDDKVKLDNNRTRYQNMVDYQHDYINSERVIREDIFFTEIDKTTNVENVIKSEANSKPKKIVTNTMIWGDPYIQTYFGDIYKLPDKEGVYLLYSDKNVTINVELWKLPEFTYHDNNELRKATFIKKLYIITEDEEEKIIIDMNYLDIQVIEGIRRYIIPYYESKKIKISKINKEMRNDFKKFEFKTSFRIFEMEGLIIKCSTCLELIDLRNIVSIEKISRENLTHADGMLIKKSSIKKVEKIYAFNKK